MKHGFNWRWAFRRQCRAIAEADDSTAGVFRITLCRRWRWHRGRCGT